MKKRSFTLFLILITAISCSTKYLNMQSFETVWQTVNEKHYNSTFGGVDWKALHDRYKPRIASANDDLEFYKLTNQKTVVKITYRDEFENIHESAIKRESRGRGRVISPAMPPAIIEFESRRLEHNLGYLKFNHFAEPVDTKFIAALNSMRDTRGIIIDLRGNSGGYFSILDTIAKHLLLEKVLLYRYRFRNRTVDKVLTPVAEPYSNPVVVLIDEKSMSCSELFAGSMQAVKRVIIVGDRSPGYLLGANWLKLPNGGSFMHTILQPVPSDGKIIEDHGVIPNIEVSLDRNALLDGRDTQLEAAEDYIKEKNL